MATTSFTITNFTANGNEQTLTNQAGEVQVVTNYFPYLRDADVKVSVKAAGASSYTQKDIVTHWTINDSKHIVFKENVLTGSVVYSVLVRRDTDITSSRVSFQTGSSVNAGDLNTNSTQLRYSIEELDPNTTVSTSEIAIADDAVTTAKILDDNVTYAKLQDIGTANRVLGKASTGTVEEVQIVEAMIADNAISMAKLSSGALPTDIVVNQDNLASNSVRESEIQDGEVKTAKIGDNQITTIKISDSQITLAKLAAAVADSLVPVGTIIWVASFNPPKGYLKCNGETINNGNTTFPLVGSPDQTLNNWHHNYPGGSSVIGTIDTSGLYAIIGSKIPDLRGEFIRGAAYGRGGIDGTGTTIHGGSGGPGHLSSGSVLRTQSDDFKNHQHQFGSDDQVQSQGSYTSVGSFGYDASSDTGGGGQRARTKDDSTNFGGTETRPRNIALLACIKY